jgi:hypothetical protein
MGTPGDRLRHRAPHLLLWAGLYACGSGVDDIHKRYAFGPPGTGGFDAAPSSDASNGGGGERDASNGGGGEGGMDAAADVLPEGPSLVGDAGADSSQCPRGFGFKNPPARFSLEEGLGDNALDIAVDLADRAAADWKTELVGAPDWLAAPSSPAGGSLHISTPHGVPYTAFPGAAEVTLAMTLRSEPACTTSIPLQLDVVNVLHLATASYDTLPADIVAADYQPARGRFVLLDRIHALLYFLDLSGASPVASPSTPLPGDGEVAGTIAAADDDIVVLRGSRLWRLGPDGTRLTDWVDIPAAQGMRSVASAGGYVVVGDSAGPTLVIEENAATPSSSTLPSSMHGVVSDHRFFAYKLAAGVGWEAHRAGPGPDFASISCDFTGSSGQLALSGTVVALQIGVASIHQEISIWDMKASCPSPIAIALPETDFSPRALGLADNRLLAIPSMKPGGPGGFLEIRLYDATTGKEIGKSLVDQPAATKSVPMIVIGGTRALVVADRPLLIDL